MSLAEREQLNREVSRLEKAGIIERSPCNTTSPCFFVKKPDGTGRLVVNYKSVNEKAIYDIQTILAAVDDVLQLLSDFQ